jgi:hypothetical protein
MQNSNLVHAEVRAKSHSVLLTNRMFRSAYKIENNSYFHDMGVNIVFYELREVDIGRVLQ